MYIFKCYNYGEGFPLKVNMNRFIESVKPIPTRTTSPRPNHMYILQKKIFNEFVANVLHDNMGSKN